MKFFDNIGKFAEGVVDYSKLKLDKSDLKRKLDTEYLELGKMVCKTGINEGILSNEDIAKSVEKIADLQKKIEDFDAKIAEMKAKVKCDACGFYNDENANFCQKCGAKLEKKPVETEVEVEQPVQAEEQPPIDVTVIDADDEVAPKSEE